MGGFIGHTFGVKVQKVHRVQRVQRVQRVVVGRLKIYRRLPLYD